MKIRTRKQAIDENCRDCIFDPKCAGTWVKQVEDCTLTNCPFYGFRPLTTATRARNQAIRVSNMTVGEKERFAKKQVQARKLRN